MLCHCGTNKRVTPWTFIDPRKGSKSEPFCYMDAYDIISFHIHVASTVNLLIIPPATKLGGGVYWNHPVRPSVCPSVDARAVR